MKQHLLFAFLLCAVAFCPFAGAQEAGDTEAAETAASPTFVVFMPEQIDTEWFWYYYTETAQHIVQAAVEKELVRAGFNVIDISMVSFEDDADLESLWKPGFALKKAKELNADFVVIGRATASRMSHNVAYGVNVYRSSAEITARLIRVEDGKVVAVEDASSDAGGQAQKPAAQAALKEAGKDIAKAIRYAAERTVQQPE
jgi:hypothetical protein